MKLEYNFDNVHLKTNSISRRTLQFFRSNSLVTMDLLQVASQPGTPITIAELATLVAVGRTLVPAMLIAGLMVRTWVARRWVTPQQRQEWVADMDQLPAPWEDMDRLVQRIMDERLIMVAPTLLEQTMVITVVSGVCATSKVCENRRYIIYGYIICLYFVWANCINNALRQEKIIGF